MRHVVFALMGLIFMGSVAQALECPGVKLSRGDPEFQEIRSVYARIHQAVLRNDLAFVKGACSSGAEPLPIHWTESALDLVPATYNLLFIVSVPSQNMAWMRMKANVRIKSPYRVNQTVRNEGDTVAVEGEAYFIKENGAWKIADGTWNDPAGMGTVFCVRDNRIYHIRSQLRSGMCDSLLMQLSY